MCSSMCSTTATRFDDKRDKVDDNDLPAVLEACAKQAAIRRA